MGILPYTNHTSIFKKGRGGEDPQLDTWWNFSILWLRKNILKPQGGKTTLSKKKLEKLIPDLISNFGCLNTLEQLFEKKIPEYLC